MTSQDVLKPARLRLLGSQLEISDPTAETHRHSGLERTLLVPKAVTVHDKGFKDPFLLMLEFCSHFPSIHGHTAAVV